MSFALSSRLISLYGDHELRAKCLKTNGTEVDSSINLNNILGNDNGTFAVGRSRFAKSARRVRINGTVLEAQLKRKDETWSHDVVDLNVFIGNHDGHLQKCVLISSESAR